MLLRVRTRRRSSSTQPLQLRSMILQLVFRVSFHYALSVLRERERASILTNADVDRQREFSCVTDHSYSASTSSTWYIDSGASSHMTGAREMFSELS